jgi:hypothetical protein
MPIEYRKSNRVFYRIEGEQVTRVINRLNNSIIEVGKDYPLHDSATDPDSSRPSSEEEFNAAFKEALERITNFKI